MKPKIILVDGQPLGDASSFRGMGTYSRNVLAGLAAQPGLDVVMVGTGAMPPIAGTTRRVTRAWAPSRWRAAEHDWRFPLQLRRSAGDVLFSLAPHPARRSRMPQVATLHDALPLVDPSPEFAVERRRWERAAPRWRGLDAVIAVSHHTAQQGVDVLGLDPARVHVAHHGIEPRFQPRVIDGDGPPFVLYVGEYGPHKGFADAFAMVACLARAGLPHRLHAAGRIAPWFSAAVAKLRDDAPRPDLVELLGFVDDLPGLYNRASALIVTSRHEGFGLPALEAMASGTPVVAYANSATVEVVAGGGVLVADGDIDAMVEAVRAVLEDPTEAERVAAAGIARARTFTWEDSVARHAQVLRSVV